MKIYRTILAAAAALAATCGASASSPYLSRVLDFMPAPGQYVNELPEYEEGDSRETMLLKAAEQICGDRTPGMISLGAYGGYVVVEFDHPVVNVPGREDFAIYGNAFMAATGNGGSAEPGIIWVSEDTNGNGVPDDPWYELAGSDYFLPTTLKGYAVTYRRPDADRAANADPDPEKPYICDRTYIPFTDNLGGGGYVARNTFHSQSYWPLWTDAEELTFEGTRLADNWSTADGSTYVLNPLEWGYADNLPNDTKPGFDIGWAVKADGFPAHLRQAHFIKVQTAVSGSCGWLGENSTEVAGGEDLHPEATLEKDGVETIEAPSCEEAPVYDLTGVRVSASPLPPGIYVRGGKRILVR